MNNLSYYIRMKAIILEKGRITIPLKIREELGLKPGQVLEFETQGGVLLARKSAACRNLEDVSGKLKAGIKNTDSYLDKIRGPRKK